jgi:hypothetical protein
MPSIRIESREELIYLLAEASELEHLLACSYLFAAFSLKTSEQDGLTPAELEAVRGWHASILKVAIDEMLHMAVVSNLLTAVGGSPNFHRPNLPQMSRYYPTDIQLDLAPFDEQTSRHFAYLERPEGSDEQDAPLYRDAALRAASIEVTAVQIDGPDDLGVVGRPQGYRSIGGLYRGIEYGLRDLEARLGEDNLFIGPPEAQLSSEQISFSDLHPVTDLASALAAIQVIVEQGEGLKADKEGTHYWRFIQIEKEYSRLKRLRPGFTPARPVLRNPFTRLPTDVRSVNCWTTPGASRCATCSTAPTR